MKLAVTYENGQIFQHFGHTEQFKIYEIREGKVLSTEVANTNGSGHSELAGWLKAKEVDALICGGIGGGAKNALEEMGIRLFGGVVGAADEAVNAFLSGTLLYDPGVMCAHHSDNGDHDCATHSCHGEEHSCQRGCGGGCHGHC